MRKIITKLAKKIGLKDLSPEYLESQLKETIIEYLKEEAFKTENSVTIAKAEDITNYLALNYANDVERVHCIFVNVKNKIIAHEVLSQGTISQSLFYPREIIKKVFFHNAIAFVIVHNHPSGEVTPSQNDIRMTKKLCMTCTHLDIKLLDHLVIGNSNKYYSFYGEGLIEKYRAEAQREDAAIWE